MNLMIRAFLVSLLSIYSWNVCSLQTAPLFNVVAKKDIGEKEENVFIKAMGGYEGWRQNFRSACKAS